MAKIPNKVLYETNASVILTCYAEGITFAAYDIQWYKLNSNKKFEKLRSRGSFVNGTWTKTFSRNGLSERDEGTYKCQIYRYPLQYSANKLVNISVKGNSDDILIQILLASISYSLEYIHWTPILASPS